MKPILIFLFTLFAFSTTAQVHNNNISDRLDLVLDSAAIHSTTAQASVEWNCVNKVLTNKCLIYHNDQWFSFQVENPGKYFINISAQDCRDNQGVQLIVIEGNPCHVNTYRILQCIPKIRKDDVFIELDSLKAEIQYLVNVDGFLGDFCEFEIALSTKPQGLPRFFERRDTVDTKINTAKNIVRLKWSVSATQAKTFSSFKVFRQRQGEDKFTPQHSQPVEANAYGAFILDYHLTDTLPEPGEYRFLIWGIQQDDELPVLLSEELISFHAPKVVTKSTPVTSVVLKPDYPDGTRFQIVVFDRSDSTLFKHDATFDSSKDRTFTIRFDEWIDKGIKEFFLLVTDFSTKGNQELYYRVDPKGNVVRE